MDANRVMEAKLLRSDIKRCNSSTEHSNVYEGEESNDTEVCDGCHVCDIQPVCAWAPYTPQLNSKSSCTVPSLAPPYGNAETHRCLFPCWTPHAVVLIGGLEAKDARTLAAPQIIAALPTLKSVPYMTCIRDKSSPPLCGVPAMDRSESDVTARARTALELVMQSHRRARFHTQSDLSSVQRQREQVWRDCGCARHGADLFELSIPIRADTSTAPMSVAPSTISAVARDSRQMNSGQLPLPRASAFASPQRCPQFPSETYISHEPKQQPQCECPSNMSYGMSSSLFSLRVRTLILFASPNTTVGELVAEKDPQRRSFLRNSFGYSIVTLRESLPAPVVRATRLLREWQRRSALSNRQTVTDRAPENARMVCSSAFWVSVVAHVITDAPAQVCHIMDEMRATLCSATNRCDTKGTNNENGTQDCAFSDGRVCNTTESYPLASDGAGQVRVLTLLSSLFSSCAEIIDMSEGDRVVGEGLLSLVLARSAVHVVRSCTEKEWRERYCTNFFLPIESFERSLDVSLLAASRRHIMLETFSAQR